MTYDKHEKIVIAVDGPAGSGKSSISKEVARKIGLKYVDSGAIYRSITWFVLKKHGAIGRDKSYSLELKDIDIKQVYNPNGTLSTYVNNEDVSIKIRDESIARHIGIISDDPDIRNYVNVLLRKWSIESSIIMDGRDIGTVVFPNADLKIYLDASADVRAARRHKEYRELGKTVDLNAIKNQIIQRDSEDKSRPVGCLRLADDAVYIDTSDMTMDEVISRVIELVSKNMDCS
jgi:CMP/dCMP kinase